MSPNRREREYARRRYEKWQAKQAARRTRRRRVQRNAAAATAAVAVVAVVVGVLWLSTRGDSDATAPAAGASPTPAANPSGGVTPGASPGPSDAGKNNPCGAPTSAPAAKPSSYPSAPPASQAGGRASELTLDTSCGRVRLELDGAKAPQAVSAMLFLAREGFFDGSPCHRLTTAGIFVLQCGDPTGTGTGGPGFSYGPVENAPEGDVYPAGTVAMARQSGNGSSMGSQFFLVYKKSRIPSDPAGGYTVLGTITSGLDVVKTVAGGGVTGGGGDGAPVRAVSIESTRVAAG